LSDAQREIMEVLWARGPATVGEVWTEISASRAVARNTVLTLMERLERKGWLARHDDGPIQRFSAARERQATLAHMARQFVDTVFSGSPEDFLLALLDGRKLSAAETERLRQLIQRKRRTER
jgi:predicted transcriptional regulator